MKRAPSVLSRIEGALRRGAGLELPSWVVEARVRRRMSALGVGVDAYAALLEDDRGQGELGALIEAVRVGETRFFRHEKQLEAIAQHIVPAWKARGKRSPRSWSAGCATGEEAYSLALVLAKEMPAPDFAPAVLGTDVSADAIAFAQAGVYGKRCLGHVPARYRDGFAVEGEEATVVPSIRARVRFAEHNLADDDAPRGFDLVLCRNVLIYFGAAERARAIEKLLAALDVGGYLFVGHSESLRDVTGLEHVRAGAHTLFRKAGAEKPKPPPAHPPRPARMTRPPSSGRRGGGPPRALEKRPRSESAIRLVESDERGLADRIAEALGAPGLTSLVVDLDAVPVLTDAVVPILRRASAAASSAGIEFRLEATRSGTQRWLRRHGLSEDAR